MLGDSLKWLVACLFVFVSLGGCVDDNSEPEGPTPVGGDDYDATVHGSFFPGPIRADLVPFGNPFENWRFCLCGAADGAGWNLTIRVESSEISQVQYAESWARTYEVGSDKEIETYFEATPVHGHASIVLLYDDVSNPETYEIHGKLVMNFTRSESGFDISVWTGGERWDSSPRQYRLP